MVRTGRSPLTNLHLGNARGDLDALRAAAGPARWAAAMATCEQAAACFPRTLQVGVDLLFAAGWRRHAVGEVNAFGDLLPGLPVGRAGTRTRRRWTPCCRPFARCRRCRTGALA